MQKLALVVPFLLLGCQTTQVDSAIQTALTAVCPGIQQVHAGFLIAATKNKKAQEYAGREGQAYAAIEVGCVDPTAVDSKNILVYIATAYVAWEIAGVK